MKYLLFVLGILGFILTCNSQVTTDIKGWGKVKWEMTEKEVEEIYANEVKPIAKDTIVSKRKKPFKETTYYSSLCIPNFAIGKIIFNVEFNFNKQTKRLVGTTLSNHEKQIDKDDFKTIEKMLVQKYGAPSYLNDNVEPKLFEDVEIYTLTRNWNLPSTIIELRYIFVSSILGSSPVKLLTIDYADIKEDVDINKL